MPVVKISFQVTEVNGTFTSAINIAMIGAIVVAFGLDPVIACKLDDVIDRAAQKIVATSDCGKK